MKDISNGWVIINIGHPRTGNSYILPNTFRSKRTEAIKTFTEGSGWIWEYWKRKYNFRCVRAELQVSVHPSQITDNQSKNK